jgi:hypothetical protein
MNRHTFKDVAKSKRSSLANDLDEDEEEADVGALKREVEGEEEDDDKVSVRESVVCHM